MLNLDPGTLGVMVPIIALMIPIVAMLVRHQQRMAELIHGSHAQQHQQQTQPEVEAMRRELSELKALVQQQTIMIDSLGRTRSEERRVGKEGRSRWSPYH